jgi:hypothetical protein
MLNSHPTFLQIRRYLNTLHWLIQDFRRMFGRDWSVGLAAGASGVLIQGAVIGLVIVFAQRLQADAVLNVFGFAIPSRSSPALLIMAICVLVSLAVSAVLIYVQNWLGVRAGFRYEDMCRQRIFLSLGFTTAQAGAAGGGIPATERILKLGVVDASQLNRAIRMLQMIPVRLFTFVAAAIAMFVVSPLLTVLVLPLVGVAMVLIYRVNIRAAAASVRFDRESGEARNQMKVALELLKETAAPIPRETELVRNLLGGSKVRADLAVMDQVLLPHWAMFIVGILLAVCVALILFFFGLRVLEGGQGQWGYVVAYLAALTYSLASLRTLASQFTSLNRFYPSVRRIHGFFAASTAPGEVVSVTSLVIQPSGSLGESGLNRYRADPGSIVGLVTAEDVNRYTLAIVVAALAGSGDCAARALTASSGLIVGSGLDMSTLPAPVRDGHQRLLWERCRTAADLQRCIGASQLWNWLLAELPSLGGPEAELPRLLVASPSARFVITAAAVRCSEKPFVFVDEAAVACLAEELRRELLGLFRDRVVFLVYGVDRSGIGRYGEDAVAIMAQDRIVAVLEPGDAAHNLNLIDQLVGADRRRAVIDGLEVEDEAIA